VGRKDNLQLLFYLKRDVGGECHLIKRGFLKGVKVEEKPSFAKEEVSLNGASFLAIYDRRKLLNRLLRVAQPVKESLRHIAITPLHNVFYVQMDVDSLELAREQLSGLVRLIKDL